MASLLRIFIAAILSGGPPPPARPSRLVSVAPTLTEIVCALGACDRLVGVTRFDDYPPEVLKLPKVGGFIDPSVEAIAKLKPDLVVLTTNGGNRTASDTLSRLQISWVAGGDQSLADFVPLLGAVAHAIGSDSAGQKLIASFEEGRKQLSGRGHGRVVVVFGHRPLIVAGPATFLIELLANAGCENAYRGAKAYATIDFEALLALHPDHVIDLEMDNHGRSDRDYYAPIAAHLSHVVFAPDPALLRLGPRLIPAVARLLDQLAVP